MKLVLNSIKRTEHYGGSTLTIYKFFDENESTYYRPIIDDLLSFCLINSGYNEDQRGKNPN